MMTAQDLLQLRQKTKMRALLPDVLYRLPLPVVVVLYGKQESRDYDREKEWEIILILNRTKTLISEEN